MAIQVSEKKKEVKLPQGMDALFQFSIILFVLVGLSYFFMMYLNISAEERKSEIETKIEETKAQIPEKEELERKAERYFNHIEDFKLILGNHQVTSPFFGPFEEMIHPEVSILRTEVSLDENEGMLTGLGEDLVAVGQQFSALKSREFISDVNLIALMVDEDEETREEIIMFSFVIRVEPELFELNIKND